MLKRKILIKGLAVMAGLFLLSFGAPVVQAQNAPVEKTGQTNCYDSSGNPISCAGTGQDGNYLKGVAWPNPRFTDNGDSTVTDNLTGLIWTKDANLAEGIKNWAAALTYCETLPPLGNGCTSCGSPVLCTDWRLPNKKELHSLIHYGYYMPALPNRLGTGQWSAGDPFDNVQSSYYWSSTSFEFNPSYAWSVGMYSGNVTIDIKALNGYVWCVRGGQ